MKSEPQKEHEWLHRLIGEWTYETEAAMGPGQPVDKFTGTETVRSMGGLWVLAEGQGALPDGGTASSMITLGYDPQAQRYVGTWIGSTMNYLWVCSGELDTTGQILHLDSTGPSMTGNGTMAKYRDIIEFRSDDHRTLSAHLLSEDGEWQQFMTTHYHRR